VNPKDKITEKPKITEEQRAKYTKFKENGILKLGYLVIAPLPDNPKTKKWSVHFMSPFEVQIGTISWYVNWRAYAFFPAPNTMFGADSLESLAKFVETQTVIHWENFRAKKGKA